MNQILLRRIGLSITLLSSIACTSKGGFKPTELLGQKASAEKDGQNKSTADSELGDGQVSEDPNSSTAIEPVAIGGAYLNCYYPEKYMENSPQIKMSCQLLGAEGIAKTSVTASFQKIDDQGQAFPLSISRFDLSSMRWDLSESVDSVWLKNIQARISINGSEAKIFSKRLPAPLEVSIPIEFWAPGEPNNMDESEPWVVFMSQSAVDFLSNNANQPSNGPLGRFNDIGAVGIAANQTQGQNPTTYERNAFFLCRSIRVSNTQTWRLSTGMGPIKKFPIACPIGYVFGLPLTESEILAVQLLVDEFDRGPGLGQENGVWVAARDFGRGGTRDFRLLMP